MQKLLLPVDKPRHLNLNSYYVDLPRLIEHFRENSFTGCIHFRSPVAEGLLYFDQDEILSSSFSHPKGLESGEEALDSLVGSAKDLNYQISVYDIDPQNIYFWANIAHAEPLYRDLNAEFTDLEALIKKMAAEKLTGYIEVYLSSSQGGFILFQNGTILPRIYAWHGDVMGPTALGAEPLIRKSRESGGTFHVRRVSPESRRSREQALSGALQMLEGLLATTEEVVHSQRKYRTKFDTLLKKKFLEKSESFPCLDPFLCEFQYDKGKVSYAGEASPSELVRGVLESVAEMAQELGVDRQLEKGLSGWAVEHSKRIRPVGVAFFQGLCSRT